MKAELVSSLAEVGKSEWDSLNATEHPFTSYDFLNSLEISNSVSSVEPSSIIILNLLNFNFFFRIFKSEELVVSQ